MCNDDDQVTLDETQLIMIATFNSICQIVGILGRRKLISVAELDTLQGAMTDPLNNPDFADSEVLFDCRTQAEFVLSRALDRKLRSRRSANRPN